MQATETIVALLVLAALVQGSVLPQRAGGAGQHQHQQNQQQQQQQLEEVDAFDLRERRMHPDVAPLRHDGRDSSDDHGTVVRVPGPRVEWDTAYWRNRAMAKVDELLKRKVNTDKAKNLIIFMGDGMSVPTLAATRVYNGGEETELSFEKFPAVGLSKTYCVDTMVADSACSATAYLCGVKANMGTMGVNANVLRHNCTAQQQKENHVDSLIAWGQKAGKWTGVVTTTRVTHASPGGAYAHTANRDWEDDSELAKDKSAIGVEGCSDIAKQLVMDSPGKDLRVIMGGGRRAFIPRTEDPKGRRLDGVNLIDEWKKKDKASYVSDKDGLKGVNIADTEYLLGLFDWSHVAYHLDNATNQPSLAEMVETAIQVLSKQDKGFVLFVEGGRIDHGHHDDQAHYALDETVQLSEAIAKAVEVTHREVEDTLIVVTSDHAHTMSMAGYANRGTNIFKYGGEAQDQKGYTIISYANGPGYTNRQALVDTAKYDGVKDQFPATVPLSSETHGGDDVGIFALGPWSHLFSGVHEQNMIPTLMAYAAAIGPYEGRQSQDQGQGGSSGAAGLQASLLLLLLLPLLGQRLR